MSSQLENRYADLAAVRPTGLLYFKRWYSLIGNPETVAKRPQQNC
jgi:hypothetical protein